MIAKFCFSSPKRQFLAISSSLSSMSNCTSWKWNAAEENIGIESAVTPPKSWYLDQIFYEKVEVNHTFGSNWLYAGRTDRIPNPGDYMAVNVMNQPLLIVRDQEKGEVKGFFNVCRHHAAQICEDGKRGKLGPNERFRCPYHGYINDYRQFYT